MDRSKIIDFSKYTKSGGDAKGHGLSLYNEGRYFYSKDDNDRALEKYLKAEKNGYVSADMFCDMSWIYGEKNNWKKAEIYAQKAYNIDSEYGRPYILLGNVFFNNEEYDKALEYYIKADNLEYNDIPTLTRMVNLLLDKEQPNYFKAYEITIKALKYLPDDAELNALIGKIYFRQDDIPAAIKYYLKAEKAGDTSVYFPLAFSWLYSGDNKKAIEYANKINFTEKDCYIGYLIKGSAYFSQEKYKEALENFEKAQELGCREDEMKTKLIYIYIEYKKDYPKALELIDEILSRIPKYFWVLWSKAYICLKLEDYKQSLKLYKKAYKYMPERFSDYDFYLEWAQVYTALKKYKLAKQTLELGRK